MSSKNNAFWENKGVLITGVNGFVGSHLAKELVSLNAKVVGLTKSTTKIHPLVKDITKSQNYQTHNVSLSDLKEITALIKKYKISIIYHLAGQAIVETGHESPLPTFEVNIQGTWNILEAARINKVKKIIIASTTHVYGDNPNLPYKEEYYPQPSRPYETSKACADLLAQCYADTYNLPVEIPRFVNIYGPGDLNFSRLIPKTIQILLERNKTTIWDVGAVRDFLYIDDAITAYKRLAEKDLSNKKRVRVFNFGSGEPIKVSNVIKKIMALSDDKVVHTVTQVIPKNREKEIKKQYISIEKAAKELLWQPETNLDEGLEKTIAWYRDYFAKKL